MSWLNGQAQRVIVNGQPVARGVLQSSVLGTSTLLIMIWIQELNPEVHFWIQVADLTKLRGAVDSPKGQEALQTDPDTMEHLTISNYMKCNKGKCQVLHLGRSNARQVQAWEMSDWRITKQKGICWCWLTAAWLGSVPRWPRKRTALRGTSNTAHPSAYVQHQCNFTLNTACSSGHSDVKRMVT